MDYDFPIILGMSSSLTNSLHDFSVRGRYKVETTNLYGDFGASKSGRDFTRISKKASQLVNHPVFGRKGSVSLSGFFRRKSCRGFKHEFQWKMVASSSRELRICSVFKKDDLGEHTVKTISNPWF
jgi:hypothetical protein